MNVALDYTMCNDGVNWEIAAYAYRKQNQNQNQTRN